MSGCEQNTELFTLPELPEGTRIVNDRCLIRTQDGHRVVIVSGIVLSQYSQDDHTAEAYTMVNLVEQGWADQNDVARAFGCSVRTVRRQQRRFEDGGLSTLGHGKGCPKGRRRLRHSRSKLIHRLKIKGHSTREIARRIGVDEKAVRKLLRRMGWKQTTPAQPLLPFDPTADPKLSAFCSQASAAASPEPCEGADPVAKRAEWLRQHLVWFKRLQRASFCFSVGVHTRHQRKSLSTTRSSLPMSIAAALCIGRLM